MSLIPPSLTPGAVPPGAIGGAATMPSWVGGGMLGPELPGLPGVAAGAPRAGFLSALTGGLGGSGGPTYVGQRLAGNPTTGLGFRSLAPGSLGRAGLYGAAGQIGKMGFDAAIGGPQDGKWDDVGGNAIAGAGLGAGIGSVVPGVGTAIGAGVGALGGAAFGWLRGGDSKETSRNRALTDQSNRIESLMRKYQVSPDTRDQILAQFQMSSEMAGSKQDVKAIAESIVAQLPQIQQADKMQRQIDADARMRQSALVAAQAWLGPLMRESVGRTNAFAEDVTRSMMEQAKFIDDPQSRAAAITRARQTGLDQSSMSAYMLQQMALTPQMYGWQTQQNATDPYSVVNATPVVGAPVAGGGAGGAGTGGDAAAGDQLLAQILAGAG